ncbi:MAG: HNH endonuclease signature motif containing protein [Chloroflexi bacterium]|nr:HNH endonuclease signature motif containing protein [Chloroflexota bacterium]
MTSAIPPDLRVQVYQLDQARCAYCQTSEDLTITAFEIDHIVPVSAGSQTTLENLCLSCPACNRFKAARQTAIAPDTGRAVGLYHPRRHEWSMHFMWSDDRLRILGITPTGRATAEALRMNRPQLVNLRRLWAKMGVFPE